MGNLDSVSPVADINSTCPSLPVVDFAKWAAGSTEERYELGKELADACHKVGFVYIVNHSVSPELLDDAFSFSKKLFNLKLEEKMLAPHPPGPTVHRGYSYPGLEKVSQIISSDLNVSKRLREVKDCKVCHSLPADILCSRK
jgi:isopenicillin N synthase-like dioxygenase